MFTDTLIGGGGGAFVPLLVPAACAGACGMMAEVAANRTDGMRWKGAGEATPALTAAGVVGAEVEVVEGGDR